MPLHKNSRIPSQFPSPSSSRLETKRNKTLLSTCLLYLSLSFLRFSYLADTQTASHRKSPCRRRRVLRLAVSQRKRNDGDRQARAWILTACPSSKARLLHPAFVAVKARADANPSLVLPFIFQKSYGRAEKQLCVDVGFGSRVSAEIDSLATNLVVPALRHIDLALSQDAN